MVSWENSFLQTEGQSNTMDHIYFLSWHADLSTFIDGGPPQSPRFENRVMAYNLIAKQLITWLTNGLKTWVAIFPNT